MVVDGYERLVMNFSEYQDKVFVAGDDFCDWVNIKQDTPYGVGDIIPIQRNGNNRREKMSSMPKTIRVNV
jgi:hypothetical protein